MLHRLFFRCHQAKHHLFSEKKSPSFQIILIIVLLSCIKTRLNCITQIPKIDAYDMTNQTSIPRSSNSSSRTNSLSNNSSRNSSISNTGTVYYPADIEQETRQTSVASKRQSREELHDDPTNHFRRKQSRLSELDDTVKISPVNLPPRSPKESGSITPPLESNDLELTQPTWDDPLCWAFLQSLNPLYDNLYLKKKTSPKDARSGYLIGRDSSSDIV